MVQPRLTWVRETPRGNVATGDNPYIGSVAMIEACAEDHKGAVLAGAWAAAVEMEAYAKQHAPWTDRSGNARANLKGFAGVAPQGDCWCANIEHGPYIDYGYYLENRMNGRYAIVGPTQEVFAPKISSYIAQAIAAANAGNPPEVSGGE